MIQDKIYSCFISQEEETGVEEPVEEETEKEENAEEEVPDEEEDTEM